MGGNECHGRWLLGPCNRIRVGAMFWHVRRVQIASKVRFVLRVGVGSGHYSYFTRPMVLEIELFSYFMSDLSSYRLRSGIRDTK